MPEVISQDGTKISYTTWGTGPTVILVDGAFCFRENGPTPALAPLLATHFTVYAYDRRGRGESTDTQPYSIQREVEDLQAIMQAAGSEACVFGMSSGAALVLHAVASGLPVKKIALYEAPFVAEDHTSPLPPQTAVQDINQLIADNRRDDAVTYFMVKVFGAPAVAIKIMKLMMRNAWVKNKSVAHTLVYDFQIMGNWSVPPEASSINAPTLVLAGEKAPQKLRIAADATAKAMPHAERRELKGQSHNVKASALAPVLAAFFQ